MRAGFRACLRCRPDDASSSPSQIRLIEKICRYIDENLETKITLKHLRETTGMSPFHLQKVFKRVVGVTPREYQESARLRRLKLSLRNGEAVTKSTYKAGYNTSSWLYSHPQLKLGMNPSSYKSGGKGLTISYVFSDCYLGRLLVGGTAQGICAVSLADSDDKLLAYLREEYPKAHLIEDNNTDLARWVNTILEYLDQGKDLGQSNLPINIRVTAFQLKVLKELQKIPYGSVRSYSEIARRVGCPDGSRAVANACASNPTALVIPCHRVVRKNGELGGYRYGVERKKRLLEGEGVSLLAKISESSANGKT